MNELKAETLALLRCAKGADGPGPGTQARIGRALATAAAAGAVTAGSAAAEAALAGGGLLATTGTAALAGVKLQLVIAAALGLTVASGAYTLVRIAGHPAPVLHPAVAVAPERKVPVQGPAPKEPSAVPRAAGESVVDSPAQELHARRATAPPSRPRDPVAEEALQLAAVQRALRASQGELALEALGRYQREFPNGVLHEESSAAEVLALCASGRTLEARQAADRFAGAFPHSPLVPRLEASCASRAEASTHGP